MTGRIFQWIWNLWFLSIFYFIVLKHSGSGCHSILSHQRMPVTCAGLGQSQTPIRPMQTLLSVSGSANESVAISVTTQSLESCFSPLLDTKGYHGFPELQAQGSKVPPNCSIDGRRWDSAALKSFPQWLWMLSCFFISRCCCSSYHWIYSCLSMSNISVHV